MSHSTTTVNQVSASQSQKEVTVNGLFDAASPALGYGRDPVTTTGLTWGWCEATIDVAGTPTQVVKGTIALTASVTNYLYATSAGTVTKVTSAPTAWPGPLAAGAKALYSIVTGTATVTSYTDYRLSVWRPVVAVNAQTGTTYTLLAGDNGKIVTLSNGAAITLTVPASLGLGFACELIQIGAGQVTCAASGVTLNSRGALLNLIGQHSRASLVAYAADVFNLSGDLA
jgi:hypothetical protein